LFEAGTGGVVQPAVEWAAQTAILATAEREIGAAMGAVTVEEADAVGWIAEQDEVLAEETDAFDGTRLGEFLDQGGGLPVAAHEGAAWGVGAGFGDALVIGSGQHRGISVPSSCCLSAADPFIGNVHLAGLLLASLARCDGSRKNCADADKMPTRQADA
jgi:hypothetical protein